MEVWLTDKDIEELGLNDGKWHKVEIEYTPPLGLGKADNELVACFKEGEV